MAPSASFWDALQVSLRQRLAAAVPDGSRVIYVDIPVHRNIGDLLIYLGTRGWLRQAGHHVLGVWSWHQFNFPELDADTVILEHGGGNFGDLYPEFEEFRRRIVWHYPNNRIVILPQTVHFADDGELARSAEVYRAHRSLHLFCRDRVSAEAARGIVGEGRVSLAPDMATCLYPLRGKLGIEPPAERRGTLYLLRRDGEAAAGYDLPPPGSDDRVADWADLLGMPWRLGSRAFIEAERVRVGAGPGRLYDRAWAAAASRMARRSAGFLLAHHRVVTSRLHGHIMAALLDIDSTVLDNSYGKNTRYFREWHEGLPGTSLGLARMAGSASGSAALADAEAA